jgi:hypothetical protein
MWAMHTEEVILVVLYLYKADGMGGWDCCGWSGIPPMMS